MFRNPWTVLGLALLIAVVANAYYYYSGNDLTVVVSRTLFADMLICLTLVPLSEAARIRFQANVNMEVAHRIKSSMKTVALYVICLAVITAILFGLFSEPLIAGKLNDIAKQAEKFVASGEITQEQADSRLQAMERFYTVTVYLPVLMLTNLFIGFVSAIPAALLIKK